MAGLVLLVREAPGVRPHHDHAARCLLAVVQRLHRKRGPDFGDLQGHRRAGVVVHVPEISADRHRHRDAVAFVVRRARGVAIGDAGKVIADHLLVVFEASAGQHHRPARLDGDRLIPSPGSHSENFLGDVVLDQFSPRRLIQDGDRALPDQALEQFPGVGIAVGRPIVELMHAVGARQVREFDSDRRMLMLLRIAAEAFEPCVVSAHLLRPHPHHGLRHRVGSAQGG